MLNSLGTSDAVSDVTGWLKVEQVGPRRVRLAGELDIAGAPKVPVRLGTMTGDVELDCSGLTFIDASGLKVLIAAHRDCEARGAMLTIVAPSRCVTRLLALTGLDSVFGGRAESSAP